MAVLSARVRRLRPSPVRAMLQASQRPEVISFAGGLPAPESFEDLQLAVPPASLLQYGPTEGDPPLRRRIAEELAGLGLDCPPERVLVLSGSQQGIDLTAKLFIDPGTPVATQSPAYLAALQVFRFFGARFVGLDTADPGAAWRRLRRPPALAYLTPTFQNPTGDCLTLPQRQAMAAACDSAGVTLFEDDPYRDLAYDICERRPVASLLRRVSWIYQGSFSKTVAPGLRLGFLAASEDLFGKLVLAKQAADLHASRLSQWIVLRYLEDPGRSQRLSRLVGAYRTKRDRFATALEQHLGGIGEWRTPPGGLFFWVDLPAGTNERALLAQAAERNVLFAPGEAFRARSGAHRPAMRLNFSHATPDAAERGLAILGELIREGGRPRV